METTILRAHEELPGCTSSLIEASKKGSHAFAKSSGGGSLMTAIPSSALSIAGPSSVIIEPEDVEALLGRNGIIARGAVR